ncbi:hypothetical protein G6F22_017734 [Rhizopus arrhizus]|nr:hypothetical protein G6F22_017734 [Rhizopus arrhizus]
MGDIQSQLPEGTIGPVVDDEFGRVAVMTMGLTGDGYNAGELRAEARRLRDELFRLPGVERVSLHGVRDEQVQIILDVPSLAARGLNPNVIADAVSKRNVIAPAGYVEIGAEEYADSAAEGWLGASGRPCASGTGDPGPADDGCIRQWHAGRGDSGLHGTRTQRSELRRSAARRR